MTSRVLSLVTIVVTVLITSCGKAPDDTVVDGADAVYLNGRLYTVDERAEWAEAVAIKDGKISYVGSSAGAEALVGDATKVVDLQGRMMLPAFQDVHIHLIWGGLQALACDFDGVSDLPGYRATISRYAAENPDVPWVLGGGWSMAVFGPGGAPSRGILDELVPDRPVYLTSADGHSAWANSKALQIAGITKETPDPVDGIIDRDPETGELVGSLQEGAMDLVARHIPQPSSQSREAALRHTMKMLHEYGITSVTDASVYEADLETFAAMDQRGELNLRVVASLWWERAQGLEQITTFVEQREKYTNGNVSASTVKIMQDGVLENYTAAMLEPYNVESGTRGIPMIDPDVLMDAVTALDAQDFQVHFHAIGDAAIRQSLDAAEAALLENGQRDNRHHISHLQVIHPDDIARFAELDVVANFQPLWAYADEYVTELNLPFLGEERVSWMYPIKSVIDSGGRVAFGSDWSVSTANPFMQIETAITREDAAGGEYPEFTPHERIDMKAAITAFTMNAAFVNGQENTTGSIEVGKLADLIVIDQHLFDVAAADISDTKVLLTLFEGRPVYDVL